MNKQERVFLGIGAIFLLLGLLWPWVKLSPPAEKSAHLTELAAMFNRTETLPQPVQSFLRDRGWKARHTRPEVKAFFVDDLGLGHTFAQVYGKTRLFSWDFFRLEAGNATRLLIGLLVSLCLLSGAVFAYFMRHKDPNWGDDEWENDEWDIEGNIASQSGVGWVLAAISLAAFVTFFFFIIQMPGLDSLGRAGERGILLMDIVLGMRVTIAPRFFIPVGLLSLILAGFGSVLEIAARHSSPDFSDTWEY